MHLYRATQISEDHCGPAVLEMLLSAIGYDFSQWEITKAAGAEHSIEDTGVTIDQLGRATTVLAPNVQFWYKYNSSLSDIKYLLAHGFPVGVEWQGLFYDSEEEEEEDLEDDDEEYDFGHYSVITHIDDDLEELIMVDPYKDFVNQDRIVEIDFFLRRWWDENEEVRDERVLFFVAPKGTFFPREIGFKAYSVVEE